MRMANEIDDGQAAGELATQGRPKKQPESGGFPNRPTLEHLGVSQQRVSDWRTLRDAGEEVVETAIGKALQEGRAFKWTNRRVVLDFR
jgi:hypothetical protein